MIKILYFARFREQLGIGEETIEISGQTQSITELLTQLRARGGVWSDTLGENERLMTAVNQEMARPQTPIHDGDEVAIFPPVTGG